MDEESHSQVGQGRSSSDEISLQEVASRTVSSSMLNLMSQGTTLILGFLRSVLLARLLLPQDYGIVALSAFLVNMVGSIASFGLNAALIQRKSVDAEQDAISTHFVLRMSLIILSFLLTLLCVPLLRHFYPGRPLLVPLVLTLSGTAVIGASSSTPIVLLSRRLAFRRLAVLDVASSATMLAVSSALARSGWGPWSLVIGEQLTGTLVTWFGVWFYHPPWRLRLRLNSVIARQYLRFGWPVVLNSQMTYLLDQFDDFWTASVLGSTPAGFYSKAYEFARYPRRIIAVPFQNVFFSAYARLQSDRLRLSKAYYRLNSVLIRMGFLLSLVLVVSAPELVELLLTAKWLPMVGVFRLMIPYALLDPLIVNAGNLSVAVGHPQVLTRVKILQLAIFIPLVILLGTLYSIEGVAVAADLMLLSGIVVIFHQVRRFVDFSSWRLFRYPLLAALLGGASGILADSWLGITNLLWRGLLKAAAVGLVYVAILVMTERSEYRRNAQVIWNLVSPHLKRG